MDNFRIFKGKKYGWDNEDYESESAARENMSKYQNEGFETQLVEENGKHYVYSRRTASEITMNGKN